MTDFMHKAMWTLILSEFRLSPIFKDRRAIGVADPKNSPSPIDGAVIVVTEQLTEV